ncbi:bifunctional GNAT family N-acetyltransferase/hotdog fold thioesterase [Thalassotalea piscium]|uniref:Thioesterase domain-containing protein n=1 Tax=Thalassotalea piscium TaxID=1230533 RepID=A0A7X0NJM8_9GAMM|nr:bifunctional GNAT family N-acetyltransferase/hotdog fold thioesterase [Thalassotalea piscium]MBB6544677.1 thioesterase domain-containing protein [Thalassotalea piscium]
MIECRAPQNPQEYEQYYQLRWQTLRAPWQQPLGSEQDELETQSVHRMVINEQGQVIAIGRLHFTNHNNAQIRYMAVADSFHGQGLGRVIIDALEQVAKKFGVATITLNAREQAVGFYQKLGYQGDLVSHVLFGEIKHIAMHKLLKSAISKHPLAVKELEHTWHTTIPMSKAMGINITYYDQKKLVTTCDLNINKNLHNTMFAGSIYTLATLAGWGWLALQLHEKQLQGDIVLAEAEVKYLSPVEGIAYATTSDKNELSEFTRLKNGRNEKVTLTVNITSGEKVAAQFIATYVVKNRKMN